MRPPGDTLSDDDTAPASNGVRELEQADGRAWEEAHETLVVCISAVDGHGLGRAWGVRSGLGYTYSSHISCGSSRQLCSLISTSASLEGHLARLFIELELGEPSC